MRCAKGEPEPVMTDPILVTHKEHGLMLATWLEHLPILLCIRVVISSGCVFPSRSAELLGGSE
ncbi:hypothetical protein GCM10010869_21050 [Mesorhizobium tianshanense]|uniref:Uncharacterized protein n=1 Tax=Mesorhizobium tianshanense TaxID=39844 RepID=A0A562MQU5_9HYPH|nr:hypothetical protein IQ26_06689 [Mesorhizobium tianshanense]GLS36516.1 hypothetical protein GCM10010869_21050 [Mesorhizobium tianshanense]